MNSFDQQVFSALKTLFPEFKCSLNDLRTPTEEFVTNFYTFWLAEFGADINNVTQVQFAQSNIVQQYHDAYSGIVAKLNLLKAIRWFEVIPDFGMSDIISPGPKRTQNNIKLLIEFFQWADDRVATIQNMKQELNQRKVRLANFMKEKEHWKEKLNSITKSIAAMQDKKLKLESEIQHLLDKTLHFKAEKQKLKAAVDECNEKLKEKEAILQKLRKEEIVVNSKIKEFSNQLVDSPSSILVSVDNLRSKSEELSELLDEKKKEVEIKMQDHKKTEDIVVQLQQRHIQLKDLLKLIDQHRKHLRTVSATNAEIKELQDQLEQFKLELIAVTNKKRRKQKALEALYIKWTALKPKLMESVEALNKELDEKTNTKSKIVNEHQEDVAVQQQTDSLVMKIKTFCEDFEKDYDMFKKQRRENFEKLKQEAQSHMKELKEEVKRKYEIP